MPKPNDTTSTVQYKLVEDRPDYRVGDDGSFWSRRIAGTHGTSWRLGDWKKLKPPDPSSLRYHEVDIDGKIRRVHVLILTAFVGPCPEGMECRHLNGNRHDNRLSNLAWGTYAENTRDRIQHGTMPCGEQKWNARLTKAVVVDMRSKYSAGRSIQELANEYVVHNRTVYDAVHHKTWKHI